MTERMEDRVVELPLPVRHRASLMLAAALLLTACASAPTAPATQADAPQAPVLTPQAVPELTLPRVAAADLAGDIELNQHLTISRGSDEHEIDIALAIKGTQLKLAAIGLGLRLITLDYNGSTVTEERHPLLPAAVNGERILRDLVISYWPAHRLQALLPAGWQLQDEGSVRTLLWQGQAVARIRYDSADPARRWQGTAHFEHLLRNYRIVIVSTEA